MTDAELVEAVRDGEVEAFSVLVERYKDRTVAAAFHLVSDRDAAEDLAQDTFVAAYRQIRRLRDPDRVGAWLHGITQRLCYKHLRRQARTSEIETERFEAIPAPPDRHDEPGELCALLNRLPDQYRQVLAARYLEDLEYEEIASLLKTTVNNVRVRCHRAKNRLRELFEGLEGEEPGLRVIAGRGGV
ncbi:MAG: sigma-70 family RNA polymerase sigma factor [Armatimonadetes bacterium]|nr:sigma-70 family RNA polymerase sigma factor [Armatimonadota bacterium]